MYPSVIGKPSRRVGLLMGLLMGLSLLLLVACDDQNSAKGGADQEHKKSTSGGTASTNLQMGATGGSAATNGQIAFGRHQPAELFRDQTPSAIFAMNPDGSHVSQITHPPEGFRDDGPEWSADGQRLAFYRQRIDEKEHQLGMSRIMVLNTETGDERQVEGAEGFDPAFSPDGHSLAFKRILGPDIYAIWIVGLDGSTLHQVTNVDPKLPAAFSDSWPQFSPDGKMLVFERSRLEDDHHAVFVQSLESSGSPEAAHQLTPWKMDCEDHPEFSSNGNWVLFSCEGEGGTSNLYWVNPDGTGLHQLTHQVYADKQYVGSSFSPKFKGWGDIVAARHPAYGYEGNSDVFRMHIDIEHGDVAPSVTVNLTKSETLDDAPGWGTH
jgi:Tol biopolymer transport system component